MFQLTIEETANLRCKNCTSSWGGTLYLPHAFTEQGVYMLMTVLKGELATRQSKAIVRTFKQMKDGNKLPMEGCHVKIVGSANKSTYIAPLCKACNARHGMNLILKRNITLVMANVAETCSKERAAA